ncbi:hypothetical protein ZWY2020_054613 [Hordeum vulgare]|nr:hypothetical protein ZWY2020_054613 [Hordeum vulgare]
MAVFGVGEWDMKNGAMPDYSMDLSKIWEMHKKNKKELSRASLSGDDDLLAHHGGSKVAAVEQEAKRVAAYYYEADPRWADYWSNVLVPLHLAACPDVLAHFRCKFYHRFIVLKILYRAHVTSSYHQSAWAKIRRTVNPYVDRLCGIL